MKKMPNKSPFSKKNMSLNNIFNPKIYPIERYIIKGDKKSLKEMPISYLNKIMTNYNIYSKNNIKNKFQLVDIQKYKNRKKCGYKYNKSADIYDENDEKDLKISEESREYLFNLYNEAATDDTKNVNTNIFFSQSEKELFKLDDNNQYIYSLKECHPFSMLYKTKYKDLIKKEGSLSLPAPRFINSEQWMKEPDLSFNGIFKGINIDNKKGLITTDPEILKKYEGLIPNIIGQILRVPFGHHISIQIKIFEPLTVHEQYVNAFSFANKFLIPASDPNIDAYERFKLCISFVFSGIYIPISQLKPFNPFLGETYQGELPNGAKIYIEQVTHSPLVARYYIIYKKVYEISGYWDLSVKTIKFGTQMNIYQKGPIYIKFPQINECIIGHYPKIKMANIISDDRANLYYGNMVFVDIKNNYKAVIKLNENPKCFHEIIGNVLKYDYGKNYVYNNDKEWEFGKKFEVGKENNDNCKYKIIDEISGSWISKLIIGDNLMWDINAQLPEFIRPVRNCIPSDGRFREDLIWLYRSFYCARNEEEKKKYMDIAQEWKIMMEEFNRWERKRRAEIKKKNKIK